MDFYRFVPDRSVGTDVKCFWALEQSQHEHNSTPMLPDTNVEVVFNCGAPYAVQLTNYTSAELPRVFINGLQTTPIHLKVTGACQIMVIRLPGWAVRAVADLPKSPMLSQSARWKITGGISRTQLK